MFDFLRRLMYGRYGSDALNQFLMVIALVLLIPWFFTHWAIFSILILALIILIYCRMFSRNIYKRSAENQKFLAWFTPIQRKLAGRKMQMQDKAHRYYKCPACGRTLRVPRGRGRIEITCPHCKRKFTKKT